MKKTLSIILCALIAVSSAAVMSGCGSLATASNDINIVVKDVTDDEKETARLGINSFSAELFREEYFKSDKGENLLLSPISVYTGLAVSRNGAKGDTADEITNVLSGSGYAETSDTADKPLDNDMLNRYFSYYLDSMFSSNHENLKLSMTNSFWAIKRDDVVIKDDFINMSRDYYAAEIFSEPLGDETTRKINSWVKNRTDNMIDKIVDNPLPKNTVALLLNAVAFDSKWKQQYTESDVHEQIFHNYDGTDSEVGFMYSSENKYISDGYAKGFIKDYESDANGNLRYCFAALLPNEDIGIDEYVEKYFTAETITSCVENSKHEDILARLPKFEFDCSYELNKSLKSLGVKSAFDEYCADFSGMAEVIGEGADEKNIYLSEVVHRTHISVDEHGTKAAAVTKFEFEVTDAAVSFEPIVITLDRPFVFAIYDYQENIPIFIGTVMTEN